jgi:hypothetical protein
LILLLDLCGVKLPGHLGLLGNTPRRRLAQSRRELGALLAQLPPLDLLPEAEVVDGAGVYNIKLAAPFNETFPKLAPLLGLGLGKLTLLLQAAGRLFVQAGGKLTLLLEPPRRGLTQAGCELTLLLEPPRRGLTQAGCELLALLGLGLGELARHLGLLGNTGGGCLTQLGGELAPLLEPPRRGLTQAGCELAPLLGQLLAQQLLVVGELRLLGFLGRLKLALLLGQGQKLIQQAGLSLGLEGAAPAHNAGIKGAQDVSHLTT